MGSGCGTPSPPTPETCEDRSSGRYPPRNITSSLEEHGEHGWLTICESLRGYEVRASFAPWWLLRIGSGPRRSLGCAIHICAFRTPGSDVVLHSLDTFQAIMVLSSNILDQTPEVIAKWPKANYVNPDELTWLPIYTCIWFGAATVMVAVRFWLRFRGHAGRLGLDDVSSLLALQRK